MTDKFLQDLAARDQSWARACDMVAASVPVSSVLWRFFRSGWQGSVDQKEFLKMLGFTRLNLGALINAAEIEVGLGNPDASTLERSLHTLGIRLSATVLAINYCCSLVFKNDTSPLWKPLLKDLMTWTELGYRFGARAADFGLENGTIAGFSKAAGHLVALLHDAAGTRSWYSADDKDKAFRSKYGCESYQVAAFLLQRLGFGHEVAIGIAMSEPDIEPEVLGVGPEVMAWRSAASWLNALREGRSYPGDAKLRNFFRDITPPKEGGQKNVALEVLYTEIAKVRHEGSQWTWHLPKASYEKAEELLA